MEKQGDASVPLKLQDHSNFVPPSNPMSDLFKVKGFHHVEFWGGDATNISLRFSYALGMPLVAKSDLSTGNLVHATYVLRSGTANILLTSPYSPSISLSSSTTTSAAIPSFDYNTYVSFVSSHGLAVRALAIEVEDAEVAFNTSVAAGAHAVCPPVLLDGDDQVTLAEVQLYGDVVLRYISYATQCGHDHFLPKFAPVDRVAGSSGIGIMGIDHAAANVPAMAPVLEYVKKVTGFHEFAEFAAADMVGITGSGLQSMVVASNNERVLLNIAEPVVGSKKRSHIQTILAHNEGALVQHIALITNDIFTTLREMRKRSPYGFKFTPSPPADYYKELREWVGDKLSEEQMRECEELGVKIDKDHEGVLLQTFTAPVGDRPTFFFEIIQRIGCMVEGEDGELYQKSGCGGFGINNLLRLIQSVEDLHEKTIPVAQ